MAIIKNSAKCTACGVEIESKHRHDFNVHFCEKEPAEGKMWVGDKLVPSGEKTFRFGVDGGRAYTRRVGMGFTDTSEWSDEEV